MRSARNDDRAESGLSAHGMHALAKPPTCSLKSGLHQLRPWVVVQVTCHVSKHRSLQNAVHAERVAVMLLPPSWYGQ